MRNIGIELFRIVCMLAICMQHTVRFSGNSYGFEGRIWEFGVVGFAFISGYYGVTLRISKVIALWVIALCSVAVSTCVATAFGWEDGGGVFKKFLLNNWYLNGYTILLLISPILNGGIEWLFVAERKVRNLALLGVVSLVGWSWCQEAYGIRNFVPMVLGNGSHSFMALIYIYIGARVIRHWLPLERYPLRVLLPIALGCWVLQPLVGGYTSLVTWGLVVTLFMAFSRIKLPSIGVRIVAYIVPSLFAIYLIHTNWFVFGQIRRVVSLFAGEYCRYLIYVVIAMGLFSGALVLDMPRRLVGKLTKQYRKEWLKRVDSLIDRVLTFGF